MDKSIIISSLLLIASFNSILGDNCSYGFEMNKLVSCAMIRTDSSDKSCMYLNDQCKEQLYDCELYEGSVASECEEIIQSLGTKCVFKNNKCISEDMTSCSEYKTDFQKLLCVFAYQPDGARCYLDLENNECKSYFEECSDYRGTDKNTCESIELNNPFRTCSYTSNGCEEKQKPGITCDSFKSGQDIDYCSSIELDNVKKYCRFYNNECTEYFKECSDYDGTNEKECNSNIPDYNYQYKCVYKGGKCTQQQKTAQIIKKEKIINVKIYI